MSTRIEARRPGRNGEKGRQQQGSPLSHHLFIAGAPPADDIEQQPPTSTRKRDVLTTSRLRRLKRVPLGPRRPRESSPSSSYSKHPEADTPQYDANTDDDIDHHIVTIGHEVVGAQGKAGIAEGRNRMKDHAEGCEKVRIVPMQD